MLSRSDRAAFLAAGACLALAAVAASAFTLAHRLRVASAMAFLPAALSFRFGLAASGATGDDGADSFLDSAHLLRWASAMRFSRPGAGQSAGRPTKTKGAGCPALPSAPTDGARRQLAFDLSIGPTDDALRQLGLTLPSAPMDPAQRQLGLTLPSDQTNMSWPKLVFGLLFFF